MYFGGFYVDDDNDTPRECNWHRYDEKHLFGVHTYWQCRRCPKNVNFNQIDKYDNIESRVTAHPLPWENL